jgi:hypothetical protein
VRMCVIGGCGSCVGVGICVAACCRVTIFLLAKQKKLEKKLDEKLEEKLEEAKKQIAHEKQKCEEQR